MSKYEFYKPEYLELYNETLERMGRFSDLPAEGCQTRAILNLVANQTIDYAISRNDYDDGDIRALLFDAFHFVRDMQDVLVPPVRGGSGCRERYINWLPTNKRDDPKFEEWLWSHKDCAYAAYDEESGHYWPY